MFLPTLRSSHQRSSVRKGILRNFAKFTGKQPWQSLFFNKVGGLRPTILLKQMLWHRCFPVNFVKCLRASFFIESCDCFWTFCVEKDLLLLPEIHNINFSFIRNFSILLNINFCFVQSSCFYYNLFPFVIETCFFWLF